MSQNKPSRLEGYLQSNTLTIVPHILKNTNTILDLRNETSVAGTVYDVDGSNDARNRLKLRPGNKSNEMNIQSAINDFLMGKRKPNRPKKVFSHKMRRAERRHQETLRELAQAKK